MPDHFDDFLDKHAAGYRAGAAPDADALWRGVQATLQHDRAANHRRRVWLSAGAAIAATLVIGVVLGRWSQRREHVASPATTVAAVPSRADSAQLAAHLHASTQDYLVDADVFLTEFRAGLRHPAASAAVKQMDRAQRSRELLARTRLLLHGGEHQSPETVRLLQDLELLLAEIAAMPAASSTDAALLQETLHRQNILPRIRTRL